MSVLKHGTGSTGIMGVTAVNLLLLAAAVISLFTIVFAQSADALSYRYLTQFGRHGDGPGLFNASHGVAVDGAGRAFATNLGGMDAIHLFKRGLSRDEYVFETSFGDYAIGVAIDPSGRVLVTDLDDVHVFKPNPQGGYEIESFFDGSGGDGTELSRALGIAVDQKSGQVFVADGGSHGDDGRVEVFTRTPKGRYDFQTSFPSESPSAIAVDQSGRVLVAEHGIGGGIRVYSRDSRGTYRLQTSFYSGYPSGITVDRNGMVFVADSGSDKVRVFKRNAQGGYDYQTAFGGPGYGPGQFDFSSLLTGIAVDRSGRVFVSDTYNYRVQVFTPVPPTIHA